MRVPAFVALLALSSVACSGPMPPSIDELANREYSTQLEFVRDLDEGPGFSAFLASYESAGLTVHAMVAVPDAEPPAAGFPVLVANHGFHPDPPRYGITAEGVDSRPGDYYRSIPELYTAAGFLVVMPDYRGHNVSEGLEYTDGFLATNYYTEDVLALLSGLRDLDTADLENVFMWGHSLGGEVTLRALLATDLVKGAALWSTVGGEIWDQAYYYSRYEDPLMDDSSGLAKEKVEELRADIAALDGPYDWQAREPLRYLQFLRAPLIIHHAVGDRGAAYKWSERLAKELYIRVHPYRFHSYDGSDHFFAGEQRILAAERDIGFFRSLMRPALAAPDAKAFSGSLP